MSGCKKDNKIRNHVEAKNTQPKVKGPRGPATKSVEASPEVNNNRTNDGFYKKGATLSVLHRIRHRHLTVSLDADPSIAVCKQSNAADGNSWVVPCDLIGLSDATLSGKKQKKKPVRFLVHPSTLELAAQDVHLATKIENCAKELIAQFFGNEWQILGSSHEVYHAQVLEFRKLLSSSKSCIVYSPERVFVQFLFEKELKDEIPLLAFELSLSLKVCEIHQLASVKLKKGCSQKVSLRFIKNNVCEDLLELHFLDSQRKRWFKCEGKEHQIRLDLSGLCLDLSCAEPNSSRIPIRVCESVIAYIFDDVGRPNKMMVESMQTTVEQLRKHLDDSIADVQLEQRRFRERDQVLADGAIRGPFKVIQQDEEEAVIQITGNSLTNSIEMISDSLRTECSVNSKSKPLHVMVNVNDGLEDGSSSTALASSPADSVDSGVSSLGSLLSSPSDSPTLSPTQVAKHSFLKREVSGLQQQAVLRQRSTSESCGAFGLKGILKRTGPIIEHRGRFTRSLSECQHDLEIKDKLDDNDDCCGIDGNGCVGGRKKHVSFSERLVQQHSFRPNSSILGQKKKNQRKSKNKLKKKLSEESSCDEESEKLSSGEISQEEQTDGCDFSRQDDKPCIIRGRVLRSSIGEEALVIFEADDAEDLEDGPSSRGNEEIVAEVCA